MRPITILCVEDDQTVLHAVKGTLELEGWRVEAYKDGAAALAKIESSEHYDLILIEDRTPAWTDTSRAGIHTSGTA